MSKYWQRTTEEWEQWKNDLKLIENIKLDRCFKQPRFGRLIDCSLHTSQMQVKMVMVKYQILDWWMKTDIHCSLVMAKSRVSPQKIASIPRLELAAAALSIKVSLLLKKELTISTSIR